VCRHGLQPCSRTVPPTAQSEMSLAAVRLTTRLDAAPDGTSRS
jgi:hypothetical protein